jgi:thiol-disulfide isomerase/thioredoxin
MKIPLFILIIFLIPAAVVSQQKTATATQILTAAYRQAEDQHKNIIVIFRASWCGWCKKMDASINDPTCKELFDRYYVITHLTVKESDDKKAHENEGAEALMQKYNGYDAGLPFWLVLDKNRILLEDCFIKTSDGTGNNIGCPASEKEVETFSNRLKATSKLTAKELSQIEQVFRKNDR